MDHATTTGFTNARTSRFFLFFTLIGLVAPHCFGGALEEYLAHTDDSFSWKTVDQWKAGGSAVTQLEVQSQTWKDHPWLHHLQVIRPAQLRHPNFAFLFITGDGDGRKNIDLLKLVADRAGIVAAVVTQVPNQPLFDGRKEDALIAFTLDRYLKTGDRSWPLLFPMVKSAVRAMDSVTALGRESFGQKIDSFVVAGASKRGWTTWLTGASDPRVKAIAPMVIDMLNMRVQTDWAEKMYGKQSEKIHDYTDFNLIAKMDAPRMVELREWIDPYTYRARYTMPKLLLLGTNDPYWVVDSLRHYWSALPEPKLVFQTPNAGHGLDGGKQASQTLAAFVQMIADGEPLPKVTWQFSNDGEAGIAVTVDQKVEGIKLWTAESQDRDFRNDEWSSKDLTVTQGSSKASSKVPEPESGYRAYLGEVTLRSSTGHQYKLSTEARVTPDGLR